ncbi:MAG TPA: glycoside hydrolase family 9 protein [Verrucomicrobiales bacterium]|nr:glycoside hydrolase family 9 protein [Verrucomicrobiales bacterium]
MDISSEKRRSRLGLRPLLLAVAVFAGSGMADALGQEKPLTPGRQFLQFETAAPGVVVLVFRDHDRSQPPSDDPEDYAVDGAPPLRAGRQSLPIYEEKCTDWRAQRYPQVIMHRIYLVLDRPFEEGRTMRIRHPEGETDWTFHAATTRCESLHVNQVGYHAEAGKRRAYYGPWLGSLGAAEGESPGRFQVIDIADERVALEGDWQPGDLDKAIGSPVYLAGLQGLEKQGAYRLVVPGLGSSDPFGFGDPWAHHIFYVHARGFYHQRCGVPLEAAFTPWHRAACHQTLEITEAPPPNMIRERGEKTLKRHGGHHDAGDFDIRMVHTLAAGWLLNAFELYPEKFTDGQLDIPESANGVPDLLDEALFSLRGWEFLQENDGGIRAGFESDRHPAYGEVTAATDSLIYRTYARHAHTTLAGAALFAYAGRLLRPFDADRAAELLTRAERAWEFSRGREKDRSWTWSRGAAFFAAGQLYLATGEEGYHERFVREGRFLFGLDGKQAAWPQRYHGIYYNLNTVAGGAVFTHYFAGYLIQPGAARDAELAGELRRQILGRAMDARTKLEKRRGYPYLSLQAWGQSTAVGRWGDFLMHAHRLTGERSYRDAACLLADWALGANPVGRCFTTGLGARPPWTPTHLDSYPWLQAGLGPVPGLVVYGITPEVGGRPYIQAVAGNVYPRLNDRPLARRYTDGWSVIGQNEFTVYETMAPNTFLHACLAPDQPLRGALFPVGGSAPPGGYPGAPAGR